MSFKLSRIDSEKELNEEDDTKNNSKQTDKVASHRVSNLLFQQKTVSSPSGENPTLIISENTNTNTTDKSNTNQQTPRLTRKRSQSFSSSKSPLLGDNEINNDNEKVNEKENKSNKSDNNNKNSLKVPSISINNEKDSNPSQNDIFIPPQIILSFDSDLDNENGDSDSKGNKIIYTSHEGYRLGEEKLVNNFEDLDKIINFGYEKEPETDGFSVIRSKKILEELENGETIEEKRRNSIKYADSIVKFDKFDNDNSNDQLGMEEDTKNKEPEVSTNNKISKSYSSSGTSNRKNSVIKDKDINKNKKSQSNTVINSEEDENQNLPEFPIKKASLQTPSLESIPAPRGRRYSTMAFVPIKNKKITGDALASLSAQRLKAAKEAANLNRMNVYTDISGNSSNKSTFSVKEFIPQRGLIYSEFQNIESGWILCKPKLLPLKSLEIQKIEKMEKAMLKARQSTGLRLTRTTSVQNSVTVKPRSKEVHTSPSISNIKNTAELI
ncbi:hypothetical protein H8356DRAFT_1005558 [Neocallimastix lanati (nom. inval.)]|jgi:hypothetical protein|uniref:Uncharacterized protein n=1 Tax=Neocallimastix californiae TaxID=1754190 RepID=A0A1Y2ELW7_9FUNG|nr:hypothetical protein H8356DRAFT_1005558 [Neocallimastix sp. JGI-2020a]ORY72532.1 hypothetical protein LY90DRAFT_667117 [Neocallimastix californiae]|eukprot:ORY72532.1 hypothetical protein LY90DRAFT_667117 [Neocallimastix californiae]